MRQLTGSDDLWFALDTTNTPMHVMNVAVYDPSSRDGGRPTIEEVRRHVAGCLAGLPLRQRLVQVPFLADLPYWVEDEGFDLDDHLSEVAVDGRGDLDDLLVTLERLAERPLDRSKPLWELTLVTGLREIPDVDGEAFAVALKLHHGQFDGTKLVRLIGRLHSTSPERTTPPDDDWQPESAPGPLDLLSRAPWSAVRRAARTAVLAGRSTPDLVRRATSSGRGQASLPATAPPPRTRFSRSIPSRHRVLGFLERELADVQAMRRLADGATINDVALALAAGALRNYLAGHGELPDGPVVITCPISAHRPDEPDDVGNRISAMLVALPTDVADPIDRLRQVCAATGKAKRAVGASDPGGIADLADQLPTNLLHAGYEGYVRLRLADRVPQPFSGVSLTNVPGPREPLYLDGARLVRSLSSGFLMEGMGLLLVAGSYCDTFTLQFGSHPSLLPDPDRLRDCLAASFTELQRRAAQS